MVCNLVLWGNQAPLSMLHLINVDHPHQGTAGTGHQGLSRTHSMSSETQQVECCQGPSDLSCGGREGNQMLLSELWVHLVQLPFVEESSGTRTCPLDQHLKDKVLCMLRFLFYPWVKTNENKFKPGMKLKHNIHNLQNTGQNVCKELSIITKTVNFYFTQVSIIYTILIILCIKF